MRNSTPYLLSLVFVFLIGSNLNSQSLVITEISENSVEILNQSGETIDLSTFWLCNRPGYDMIGSLDVTCGDLSLTPGSLVAVTPTFTLNGTGDELGLFTNNSFGDPNAIIDYVIWGDRSGSTRESTAVSGGIWTAGERATSFGLDESLVYDGEGDASADYFSGSTSTPCVDCPIREGSLLANDSIFVSICIDSPILDSIVLTFISEPIGESLFITTDTSDIIVSVDTSSILVFDSSFPDVCRIRQVSFVDSLEFAIVGASIDRFMGCFLLSNTVTINKLSGDACEGDPAPTCDADGGNIFLSDSTTAITFCVEDTIPDIVPVTLEGAIGSNSQWLITDTSLQILRIDTTNVIDFTGLGDGNCLIWHLSFEDDAMGVDPFLDDPAVSGCFDLSNSIAVTRTALCDEMPPVCEDITVSFDVSICPDESFDFNGLVITEPGSFIDTLMTADGCDSIVVANVILLDVPTRLESQSICEGESITFMDSVISIPGEYIFTVDAPTGCDSLITLTLDFLAMEQCTLDCSVEGGTITLPDSMTSVTICIDDNIEEPITESLANASGPNSAWVITDTSLNILRIDTTNTFVLDDQAPGVCLIWHLSFEDGLSGAEIGANAGALEGCFDLSNSIEVLKEDGCGPPPPTCDVMASTISTIEGETMVSVCIDDDEEELVQVQIAGGIGSEQTILLTDENLTILMIENNTTVFSLESRGEGRCLIWHVQHDGTLSGAQVGANAGDLSGCFELSNSVIVDRFSGDACIGGGDGMGMDTCSVVAASILSQNGTDQISICTDDDNEDLVIVSVSGGQATNNTLVVTDTSLNIILIESNTTVFNLESQPLDICLIWHLGFESDLTGADIGSNAADLDGCFVLSNPITVTKLAGDACGTPPVCEAEGGDISLPDSTTSVTICVVDDIEDAITVDLIGASGTNSAWVITDTLGVIMTIDTTNTFVFDGEEAGVCLIWHLSFEEGLVGAELGQNANDLEGCFDLSNPIQVTKEIGCGPPPPPCEVMAGSIVSQTGTDQISICADDDIEETIIVTASGAEGLNTAFVVTDTALNILLIEENTNVFSLESIDQSTLLVWLISFDDTIVGFEVGSNAGDLAGCFALSNSITVTLLRGGDCIVECSVDGGEIFLGEEATSTTVCVDDNIQEPITPSLEGASGSNSLWLITDTSLNIVSIDTSNTFVFENTGAGTSLIWHVSFEDGVSGVEIGANASDIEGCFDLSNPITIIREIDCGGAVCTAQGGTLTSDEGATTVIVCGGDGMVEPVGVDLTGNVGDNSSWVLTDTSGVIIGFPLAPPFNLGGTRLGVIQIWSLSFEGTIQGASLGANVADITGCFAFSNPLNVNRVDVTSSSIAFPDSTAVVDICVSDEDSIDLGTIVSGGDGMTSWIITDSDDNILFVGDDVDLGINQTGNGTSFIRLVTHASDFMAEVGTTLSEITGCLAISNVLTVNVNEVIGGSLLTEIGSDEITVCIDDDMADDLDLRLLGASGAVSTFVITDTSGVILGTSDNLDIPFEEFGSGVCLLWHLSSDSALSIDIGTNASDLGGCLSFSNPVFIDKVTGDDCPPPCPALGGIIMTLDGDDSMTICVDDEISDAFALEVTGAQGDSSAFVVTDIEGNVLGVNPTFQADLEGTGAGTTLVRFISFNAGTILPENGGNINELTGCFALSNIFTINRVVGPDCSMECLADAGFLSLSSDASDTFCTDDGEADIVDLVVVDDRGERAAFLFVTDDGVITDIIEDSSINLEGTGEGNLLITYLVYTDTLSNLGIGSSIDELDGCFDLSNTIEVFRLVGEECPGVCITDGGMIFTESDSDDLEFCAGDVFFTVDHTTSADTLATSYFYVITDEAGEVTDFRLASEGGDFNLDREPGGTCRVYGYNTDDPESIALGENVESLEEGCGDLSSNFVTIIKQTGGTCDEGCHAPRDVRIESLGRNRWTVRWDRVVEAEGFIVRVGFEGLPNSFTEVSVRRNRINLTGPPGRILVIQLSSDCGFGEMSPFTREIRLVEEEAIGASASIGRSFDVHHGTVLANGVVINEQALVYPNPAIDDVTIWFENDRENSRVILYDQTGQIVHAEGLVGQQEWHHLSVSQLPPGLYFMTIESEGIPIIRDKLIIADY